MAGNLQALQSPYAVMVDATTLTALNVDALDETVQVGSAPAVVKGWTRGSQSIVSSAFVFTSLENANAYVDFRLTSSMTCQIQAENLQCNAAYVNTRATTTGETDGGEVPVMPPPMTAADLTNFVLVQAAAGVDVLTLKQRLEASLPDQLQVITQAQMAQQTRQYWLQRTGIGLVLGLGATVGVIVGMVIIGQILYASVSDHLQEFGTLKAIGASNRHIAQMVLEQAFWMAVAGYGPGMALCYGVGVWLYAAKGVLILITPGTALGIFGLTIVMSAGSALFAVQKVCRIDPMMVFKA